MLNYRAGARDLDGNWRIIQRSVEIEDGTLPSIDIQYKTPFTSRPFKVWVVATDNREVWETSLKYSIDGDSAQISALFPGPYYEIELPPEATTITLYGSARDGNRNENISRVVLEVLDGTPPVVEFSNLEIGQDGSISLFFTCEDNRELARIWVILIGEDDHAHNVSMDPVEGIDQVITFSKKGLGGEFNYTIYAVDAQGNVVSTDARTIVLPVDGSGSASFIWIVLLLIAILIVLAVAVFIVYYKRSRPEENQVEIEKIKEVFDHFEVGTRRKDMDCYKVLGVPNSATVQEITKSYRELALVHHPDMIGNGASVDDAEMKRINCAKAILIDPEKRAILDRYLGSR